MKIMNPFKITLATMFIFSLVLMCSLPNLILAGPDALNVNEATAKQLESLPGIGKETAKRIVEFRKAEGPFQRIDDLQKVKGIGKGKLAKIKDLVTIGISAKSPSP